MTDQTEREATAFGGVARWPKVQGKCPACGRDSLFLGSGGYVTCAIIGCSKPDAATDVLASTSTPHVVTTVEPGLYSDVTLAAWNAWVRDRDEWELPPMHERIDERTVEFAVALANTFGPTDDTRADSHVEVVSWFMEDAIECIEHVPAGPIQVTKIDATHGNYSFAIVVNGFVFVVPDGEGDIYIEPLCPLPATVLTPAPAPHVVTTVDGLRDLDPEKVPAFVTARGNVMETRTIRWHSDKILADQVLPATPLVPMQDTSEPTADDGYVSRNVYDYDEPEPSADVREALEPRYVVTRRDGRDAPGQKHHGCRYFVLDLTHDPKADPLVRAYFAEPPADVREVLTTLVQEQFPVAGGGYSVVWEDLFPVADAIIAALPGLGYVRIDPTDGALVEKVAKAVKPLFDQAGLVDLDAEDYGWDAARAALDAIEGVRRG